MKRCVVCKRAVSFTEAALVHRAIDGMDAGIQEAFWDSLVEYPMSYTGDVEYMVEALPVLCQRDYERTLEGLDDAQA